jgi:hypothetical protein
MENVSRPEEDEIRAWGTSTSFTLAGERERKNEMGEGEREQRWARVRERGKRWRRGGTCTWGDLHGRCR